MKTILLIWLLMVGGTCFSQGEKHTHCFCFTFKDGGTAKHVKFETTDFATGTMQHEGQTRKISVKQTGEKKLVRSAPTGTEQFEYEWQELANGRVIGIYTIEIMGVQVWCESYKRVRDNKVFKMELEDTSNYCETCLIKTLEI